MEIIKMRPTTLKSLVAASLAASTPGLLAHSVSGQASAEIITPIQFKPGPALSFGKIIVLNNARQGDISVSSKGVQKDCPHLSVQKGTHHHGVFTLTAEEDREYSYRLNPNFPLEHKDDRTIKMNVRIHEIEVHGITVPVPDSKGDWEWAGKQAITKAAGADSQRLQVGATLTVPAGAKLGKYLGTYVIDVVYKD